MASVKRTKPTPDGKRTEGWRARYRDDAGREHERVFRRKVDATNWLAATTSSLVTGTHVDPGRARMTVGAWADRWLATKVGVKGSTLHGYEGLLRVWVLPRWSAVPLTRVTNADVAAWVALMVGDGLSPSRVRAAHQLLHAMLKAAVRDRRLAVNPATDVDLPRIVKIEHHYLTHGEVADLAARCGHYETLVLTLAYTGIRWGEAAALTCGRVDLERRRLRVAVSLSEVGMVTGTPKTHQARPVPFPGFLGERLAGLVADRPAGALVFSGPSGGVLRGSNFRRRVFDPAATAMGLDVVPHDLRHTAASLAVAAGASVKGVQAMLGHKSAAMTLDIYADLWPDELDAVAGRLDEARTISQRATGR